MSRSDPGLLITEPAATPSLLAALLAEATDGRVSDRDCQWHQQHSRLVLPVWIDARDPTQAIESNLCSEYYY